MTPAPEPLPFRRFWPWAVILFLAVVLAYQSIWTAGFIWDDELELTGNPCIAGPLGFGEIWTTRAADICPLTISLFWLEHLLWDFAPLPYHLVNIAQHALGAILLWRLLRELRIPAPWLGAALWALHPVEVESVAWIAEMKNTFSGIFYFLTLIFFVRWLRTRSEPGGKWNYALTLLAAAAAMAAKASTIVLPAILCLVAWWVEGRWNWKNLLRVAPLLAFALIAGLVSLWTQDLNGANLPLFTHSWPFRFAAAGDAVWFYLGKLLWPHPLLTIYPRWEIDTAQPLNYLPLVAVVLVSLLFWLKRDGWARPWFFAWSYFLIALSPILGFANNTFFRYSLVADHFQYLAAIGPLALAAAGAQHFCQRFAPAQVSLTNALAGAVLLLLGVVSWRRGFVYNGQGTLWSDELARNPACWAADNNLGNVQFYEGHLDEAIRLYHRTLQLFPNYAEAHTNLGLAYHQQGRNDLAIPEFKKVLEINPFYNEAHDNLGSAYLIDARYDDAADQFHKALQLDARDASAWLNLGIVASKTDQLPEAIADYRRAIAITPKFAAAHFSLGNALASTQPEAAIAEFRAAVKIRPGYTEAHTNLANLLLQQGQLDEALVAYQKAADLNPANAQVHDNLGNALAQKGRLDDAIAQYQKAIELDPHLPDAENKLGIALAQRGRLDDAIVHFRRALALDPNYAQACNNLGNALYLQGKIPEAIAQFQQALRLNPNYTGARENLKKVQAAAATR
jgi:tetratricopeptide (TPR) repeat protein